MPIDIEKTTPALRIPAQLKPSQPPPRQHRNTHAEAPEHTRSLRVLAIALTFDREENMACYCWQAMNQPCFRLLWKPSLRL
ncbi:hypothetical protein ElyMa_002001900 [Elysia marginata]|uniref:Uncharacterized protein n=1 Tax=Elysia marginata TaxID=1093978 RepID=A0AAV4F564_9GAST|nr:hypothetical protein ElyMa_002001900 [Elysia marginata]